MTQTPISQLKRASIGALETVSTKDLSVYYKNARRGDVDLIAESMQRNGVYKPLVVNRGTKTGRPMEVLCGNHSLMAIRRLADENPRDERWQTVDVYVIDVDEQQAARTVIADNKANDEATYEVEELVNLLTELPDLAGTGFDRDELDELLEALDTPELEEETPPEETANDSYDLLVECADAEERARVKKQLLAQGVVVSNV